MNFQRVQLIIFSLLFMSILNSCSYKFYPQQIDVYCFDSTKQTKIVFQPYFNMINFHAGIAHSFSNHFFISFAAQADKGIPMLSWFNGNENSSSSISSSLGLGYYSLNKKGNGIEVVPGLTFEKNKYSFYENSNDGIEYNTHGYFADTRLLVPSIQPTKYFKGRRFDVSLTEKISWILQNGK